MLLARTVSKTRSELLESDRSFEEKCAALQSLFNSGICKLSQSALVPLMILKNNLEGIDLLHSLGVTISENHLRIAVELNRHSMVDRLLKLDLDCNMTFDGITPLYYA